jgi:hypothetical protein
MKIKFSSISFDISFICIITMIHLFFGGYIFFFIFNCLMGSHLPIKCLFSNKHSSNVFGIDLKCGVEIQYGYQNKICTLILFWQVFMLSPCHASSMVFSQYFSLFLPLASTCVALNGRWLYGLPIRTNIMSEKVIEIKSIIIVVKYLVTQEWCHSISYVLITLYLLT